MEGSSAIARRLRLLSAHLGSGGDADALASSSPCAAGFSAANSNELSNELSQFLVRDNQELRQRIFDFLRDDLFAPKPYLSLMEFRELTLKRLQAVVQQKFFSVFDYTRGRLC